MVILGKWNQKALSLSLKPSSLTISLESGGAQVFSYDGEGRLWTAMLEGVSYRRGLNGKIVAKWQEPSEGPDGAGRGRRWLATREACQVEERARLIVEDLLRDLRAGQVALNAAFPDGAWQFLERAARFDRSRYGQDVQRYGQVYQPVGILPPDQYMAVVLQVTEGCSFNTCTFCNFYRGRHFHIKRPEEFLAHARVVKEFLGDGLNLRRTIFLGDANALVVPMPRLIELVEIVHQVYDVERLGGMYAFLDGFSGEKKSAADYTRLAELGMKRIYIGMESGNADLLRILKKPGKPEDVIQAVQTIKAGGIAVGIIVLLGAGGHAYARAHVRDTIAAINSMPLDLDDLIYFSELIESEGLEYTRDAYEQQLTPLSSIERIAQGEAIEAGLKFSDEGGVPHISRYDIREFVY